MNIQVSILSTHRFSQQRVKFRRKTAAEAAEGRRRRLADSPDSQLISKTQRCGPSVALITRVYAQRQRNFSDSCIYLKIEKKILVVHTVHRFFCSNVSRITQRIKINVINNCRENSFYHIYHCYFRKRFSFYFVLFFFLNDRDNFILYFIITNNSISRKIIPFEVT